ncbi:MAG: cupin domain-containing protein, partial [Clostridiales bacterium]|nr:cupin domain-containing protein [Clostridiales bacterium]
MKRGLGIYPHAAYFNVDFHYHDFFEMIYVHQGSCVNIVDGKEILLQQGDLCLLNTHAVHNIRCPQPEDTVIFNILVSQSVLEASHFKLFSYNDFVSDFFLNSLQKQRVKDNYLVFHSRSDEEGYVLICRQMITEYYENEDKLYQEPKLILLFDSLLIDLIRNYQQQHDLPIDAKSSAYKISEIMIYMEEHCDTVTLQSLAEHFNYHP